MPYKDPIKRKEYHKQYSIKNKEKINKKNKKWIEKNKEYYLNYHKEYNRKNSKIISIKNRERRLIKKYNLSIDKYNKMLQQQNNKCAICKIDQKEFDRPLSVDHNHLTGQVRGLLCVICNTNVGVVEEKIKPIQEYLNKYKEKLN